MPDRKHDFTKKEIQAGLLVLASLAVLLGFVALIGGWRPKTEARTYTAKFANTIGLDVGADVRFGGVKVGRVTGITPDEKDRAAIRVAMEVLPTAPVNAESVATVEQISLTSPKHLDISTGKADAALLANGAEMKTITKSGALVEMPDLGGILGDGKDLIADVREMLGVEKAKKAAESNGEEFPGMMAIAQDVRDLLGAKEAKTAAQARGETMATAARLAEDVRVLLGVTETAKKAKDKNEPFPSAAALIENGTAVLKEMRPKIDTISSRLASIEDEVARLLQQLNGTLGENRGAITEVINDLSSLTNLLNAELEGMADHLKNTLKNTENLTGEAADMLQTNRAEIDRIVSELSEMTRHLSDFTKTLREHPDALIKGKQQEGRRPGE